MELFINETAIDITPSENDNVQSLLNAVSVELEEGLIIVAMEIDGEFFDIDDPKTLARSINSIQKINLTISSNIEIGISLIEDGKKFIKYSSDELKKGSTAQKTEMIQAFYWIIESMEALQQSLVFPPTDLTLIKADIQYIMRQLDQDTIELEQISTIAEQLESIYIHMDILKEKIQAQEDFSQESVLHKLKEIQEFLPGLASNFQTGNDVQAIQELCKVIDGIELYLRYAASKSEDPKIEKFTIDLKDLSNQMLSAFENKDFILISDLLEYDLSEKIDEILE